MRVSARPERPEERFAIARPGPVPVGSFPPNPNGLYELLDNVQEWLEDPAGGLRHYAEHAVGKTQRYLSLQRPAHGEQREKGPPGVEHGCSTKVREPRHPSAGNQGNPQPLALC